MLSQKRIAGGTEHTGGRFGMFGKLTPDGARFSPFFAAGVAGTAGVISGAATGMPSYTHLFTHETWARSAQTPVTPPLGLSTGCSVCAR